MSKLQRLRIIYLRRLASYERGLERRLRTVFNKQAKFLNGQYKETETVLASDLDKYSKELRELLSKYFITVGTVLGASFVQNIKAETPFERELRLWAIQRAAITVDTIENTTWEAIQKTIAIAEDKGLGTVATANAIKKATGGTVAIARAKTIARTELHMAANVAGEVVAKATGLKMKKTWVSAQDDRTRSSHRAANGQTVDIDEPFIVNGYSMMHPADPNGPASEVINCRCTTVYTPE